MSWAASKLWSGPIETVGTLTESYLGYYDPDVDSEFEQTQFFSILASLCNDQDVKVPAGMDGGFLQAARLTPSEIMLLTQPDGTDPQSWPSIYPGQKFVFTGDSVVQNMMGTHSDGYIVGQMLHNRVESICSIASFQFGGHNDGSVSVFPEGTTRHSAMDRSQLMALIFEIYLIIIESTLSGDVVLAPGTIEAMLEHSTGVDQSLQAGLGNSSDLIKTIFKQQSVYSRLIPTLVQDTGEITGYNVSGPQPTCNLEDITSIFKAFKQVNYKNVPSIWQEDDPQFLKDLESFGGLMDPFMSMLSANQGVYGIDPKTGTSITTSNVRKMLMTAADEHSAPAAAFSPAAVLLSFWTITLAITWLLADFAVDDDADSELINAYNKVPDRFRSFLSNTSVRQIGNATYRLKLLEQAESNYGFTPTDFNSNLDEAALSYLETFNDDETQDIIFIGVPISLMRNHLLKYTNEFSDKTFNSAESLKYTISADRSSEFSEFVTFTPDFGGIVYDSKYSINREMIALAAAAPGASTFEDMLLLAEFFVAGADLVTLSTKKGQQIFEEGGADELKLARTVLESEILKYIFERTTRLTVSEWCLSDNNINMQGVTDLAKWHGQIKTNNAPSLSEPGGGFNNTTYKSLYKKDTDLENRLEPAGLAKFAATAGYPLTFETSKEKLSKVLEPQLVRSGQEAYYADPLISKKSLVLSEILSHSQHARGNSIASSVFTPGIFDLVIGVRLEGIHNDWITDTGSIPEDTWKDAAESSSVGLASTIDNTVNGLIRVDNYRLTIRTALSEG